MLRKTVFFTAVAALCLSVAVATATAGGGNSGNAKLCQQGGWKSLHKADGSSFSNTGDCVSYAANGGTIAVTPPAVCDGTTCRYVDAGGDTSVTAPQGALDSVTFSPPNTSYGCNANTGPSIGAIVTYVPNLNFSPSPFNITFRYNATEVQNYIQQHDHDPVFCLDKGDGGFQQVDLCDRTNGQTPCVVSQGFEFAPNIEVALIPIDYQVTVSVTPADPRGAMGN